jgi:hypothetical protein
MEELAPVPFLAPERALAIAMMSYNGRVDIGLMGDYDVMEDLDDFGDDIKESLEELRRARPAKRAPKARATAPPAT